MAAKRQRDSEAAWVTVARSSLPGHLTWAGFCRTMGWPGYIPTNPRTRDDQYLSFFERVSAALQLDLLEFFTLVVLEKERRKSPNMEV